MNKAKEKTKKKYRKTRKHKKEEITVTCTNARGLNGKIPSLLHYINEYKPDIMGISETWMQQGDRLQINGYICLRADRKERNGGGILLLMKKQTVKEITKTKETEDGNEMLWVKCKIRGKSTNIGVLYGRQESRTTIDELREYYNQVDVETRKPRKMKT